MSGSWQYPNAITQLAFFQGLFDQPSTYSPAAGGQATWSAAQLSSKTFLGHPAPFTSLVVADTPTPITVTITMFLNDMQALNITRANIQIAYNAAQHQLIAQAVAAVDLVATMLIAQRVQSGQVSWNTAAGYLLNMRQTIVNSSGFLDMNKVSDAYGQWYSMWSSGMPQVSAMSPIERFGLGMRTPAPTSYSNQTPNRAQVSALTGMFSERMTRSPTLAQVSAGPRSQQLNGMFGRERMVRAPPATTTSSLAPIAPMTTTSRLANTFTPPTPPSQQQYGIPSLFRAEHAAVPRHPMQTRATNRNPNYGSSTRGSEHMTMSQLRANNTPREYMVSPTVEQMTVADLRRRELMRTNTVASLFDSRSERLTGLANMASDQLQYSRMGGQPISALFSSQQ